MKIIAKIILCVLIASSLILLLSPFIALILPGKVANHAYYRLFYHLIAEKEVENCLSDKDKAIALFNYVLDHQFMQGEPRKSKPIESLIFAEAYCDFQARTLNSILGIINIPARYAMLFDKDGSSPHTLNEIKLDGKWGVFDLFMNVVFTDKQKDNLSLKDLSDNPNLILEQEKFLDLKAYDAQTFDYWMKWYSRMFPMPIKPERSKSRMQQAHIFDYITDAYYSVFGTKFFNFYQNIYLKFKKDYSEGEDFKLFYKARSYHLAYRGNLALENYRNLLKEYPQSKYQEDTVFFLGKLYLDLAQYPESIKQFNLILEKYGRKWKDAAYYYLGQAYSLKGDKEASLKAFFNTNVYKLSPRILKELYEVGFIKSAN